MAEEAVYKNVLRITPNGNIYRGFRCYFYKFLIKRRDYHKIMAAAGRNVAQNRLATRTQTCAGHGGIIMLSYLSSDLVTALAGLDVYDLSHFSAIN